MVAPPFLHLLPAEDWAVARARGKHEPASLADEGFVHCTLGWDELVRVGNRYYRADPRPYLVLTLEPERLDADWRFDDPAQIYPHVYGPLNLSAVARVTPVPRAADGAFVNPKEAAMPALTPYLVRLDAAGAALADTQPAVERGAPWPIGAMEQGGPEHEWAPVEVLAHVGEMLPFWFGEMERIVAGAPGPTPFGRISGDQIRALSVARDASLPVRELYARIAAAIDRYRARLPELTDGDLAAIGLHPSRGEQRITDLLEKLVVGHLEEHVRQLTGTLGD
jgi:uncharacterized protein (DUF952 family)